MENVKESANCQNYYKDEYLKYFKLFNILKSGFVVVFSKEKTYKIVLKKIYSIQFDEENLFINLKKKNEKIKVPLKGNEHITLLF